MPVFQTAGPPEHAGKPEERLDPQEGPDGLGILGPDAGFGLDPRDAPKLGIAGGTAFRAAGIMGERAVCPGTARPFQFPTRPITIARL